MIANLDINASQTYRKEKHALGNNRKVNGARSITSRGCQLL